MKKWFALALVVLITLCGYVAVGPYFTVRAIRIAMKEQDATALSRQVDFPALFRQRELPVRCANALFLARK